MNKTLLFTGLVMAASMLGTSAVLAQTTPPYLVVERVGDGSAALTSVGTAVFLDEYSLSGTLISSYALPTTGTSLVDSGSATSDGQLTTSGNGNFLLIPGYAAAPGTTGVASSASATVPREIATLSGTGTLTQTTFNNFTGNNIRSVASQDGTTLFAAGGNVGIVALTSGVSGTAGTVISNTSINNRVVGIFNNQLYLSTGSGTALRIATVGGSPVSSTTTGQVAAEVPGVTVNNTTPAAPVNSPYSFFVTTLGTTAGDTLYVADNGTNSIEKFSLSGGTFTLTGTATLTNVFGLTGRFVNGAEQLFATTPTGIYTLADASGAGGTLSGTPTLFASAGTNQAFRGVTTFNSVIPNNAPTVPEPSTCVLFTLGSAGLLVLGRKSRTSRA